MPDLRVAEIRVVGVRKPDEAAVAQLVDSIAAVGLLNPITVTTDKRLIAGLHRLHAHKRLKRETIAATIIDVDVLTMKMVRIDENLVRRQLTALERADLLAERKGLYEQLHPETKQGGAPGKKGGGKSKTATVATFAKDTSSKTGEAERSVRRYTQISKGLDAEAKAAIATTPAADSVTELEKLARLPAEEQRTIAKQVAKTGETVKAAARSLKRATQLEQIRVYVPPAGEFSVIVADPPWRYSDQLDGSDAVRGGCPYPTMDLEAIKAMRVPAAADCVLWLWTTNAFLADGSAAEVVKAWGFEAKTILTWVKPRIGVGRWLRNCTEHCILAVRGSPKVDLAAESTMLMAPAGEHSAKPELFYRLVEKLCPSPARLELFARTERAGWSTSGAELPKQTAPEPEPDQLLAAVHEPSEPKKKTRKRLLINDVEERA